MSPSNNFVHLHVHTDVSALDGLSTPGEYITKAKQLGQEAIAITDHGVVAGLPEFYFEARKQEIEPILGCEFYFVPDVEAHKLSKAKATEDDGSRYHLTVLAKGAKGYNALAELSTESFRNFYYKPLVDKQVLSGASLEHLVVLSGCASSVLSKYAMEAQEKAEEELLWWVQNVPNYYIELQHHGTEFDWTLNSLLYKLARKHKLPWVITNDPHFAEAEDCDYHDVLLAVGTQARLDDPKRMRFDGKGYWLKSDTEMRDTWKDYQAKVVTAGLTATAQVAWACQTRIPQWEKRSWHIPEYKPGKDSYKVLARLAHQGLRNHRLDGDHEYEARLERELEAIKSTGISDHLLIARDCIRWAQRRGIPVGPGRGSVCGSLVCYLVGIHKVDPIRYNLLFERFLNPARPSMPDIDTDFGQERRKELFKYVAERYGEKNVMHVATFQRKKLRGMFNSLAKANGVPYQLSVAISKRIPEDAEADTLEELIKENPILNDTPGFVGQLRRLAGVRSGFSQHPAGVLIAPPGHKLHKHVPQMMIGSSKQWVAQYDLEAVDRLGYLKQDFLGLRTLDTIKVAVELIEQSTGERLNPDSWVPDEEKRDKDVYAMLDSGATAGVFQMEGRANTRGIQQIGCRRFEDIVSCTALFRTGPIVAGFPDVFIANRERGTIAYHDPRLEPIIGSTEGVILYQEQVMDIGYVLAGFDWAQVDDLKEAIKHKKSTLMDELKPSFIKGCHKNGLKSEYARKIWAEIEGYSGYAFNRSHAVAYSLLSYQTARLKCLYPLEFYAALLRTVDEKDKRRRYLKEIVTAGYKVLRPDINRGEELVTPVHKPEGVRFGLRDIGGIGPAKVRRIINSAPFQHPGQVGDLVDQGTYRALAESGALRKLGVSPHPVRSSELLGWNFKDRMSVKRDLWEKYLNLPPEGGEEEVRGSWVGELVEIKDATTKKGDPYKTWKVRWDPGTEWDVRVWQDSSKYWNIPVGSFVRIIATWQPAWNTVTVNHWEAEIWVWSRGRWIRGDKMKPIGDGSKPSQKK